MLVLKRVLRRHNILQAALARGVQLSPATIAQIVNHHHWPQQPVRDVLEAAILKFLHDAGVECDAGVFAEESPALDANQDGDGAPDPSNEAKDLEETMLLRKQTLSPAARQMFGLSRNPFDDVRSTDEVFITGDIRYVRESMRQTSRHGGFMAVVAESGAGKSTLRRDLAEFITASEESIIMIEPYVLAMEDNDTKGKTLKATHIAEAIMAAVAPLERMRSSPEARFQQLHNALRESSRAGHRHVLVIEEAHSLPVPTLKHLKRFYELEDGFKKLIGIILIGQPELAQKLDERNPSVREVVQRCEMVTLRPLDNELEGYLTHRFQLADKRLPDVIDADGIEALRTKLAGSGKHSVLYPLPVHNVLTAALNEAASLGVPKLTADLIRSV